jgi:hypothetical protein
MYFFGKEYVLLIQLRSTILIVAVGRNLVDLLVLELLLTFDISHILSLPGESAS